MTNFVLTFVNYIIIRIPTRDKVFFHEHPEDWVSLTCAFQALFTPTPTPDLNKIEY